MFNNYSLFSESSQFTILILTKVLKRYIFYLALKVLECQNIWIQEEKQY